MPKTLAATPLPSLPPPATLPWLLLPELALCLLCLRMMQEFFRIKSSPPSTLANSYFVCGSQSTVASSLNRFQTLHRTCIVLTHLSLNYEVVEDRSMYLSLSPSCLAQGLAHMYKLSYVY